MFTYLKIGNDLVHAVELYFFVAPPELQQWCPPRSIHHFTARNTAFVHHYRLVASHQRVAHVHE